MVITTDVHGLPLCCGQFGDDLVLRGGECFGNGFESCRKLGIVRVVRHSLRPVESEVIMAATIVDFVDLARRRFVFLEIAAVGLVQGIGDDLCPFTASLGGNVLYRYGEGEELSQRIPAQMTFLDELLHVLGRRTTGPRFVQAATRQQGYRVRGSGTGR